MFRARTKERFDICEAFIGSELSKVRGDEYRNEVLNYFWPSFRLLGFEHVKSVPQRVLDLALPGLVILGHKWRERDSGPWEVVHDQSSNMAKQKWLWDALSSPSLPAANFAHPYGEAIFPMNVCGTRFADSKSVKQLQICDLLAGATNAFVRGTWSNVGDADYVAALIGAGIEKLIIGAIWPDTAVTPEQLGRRGWDGNLALEWLTEQMRDAGVMPPSK